MKEIAIALAISFTIYALLIIAARLGVKL